MDRRVRLSRRSGMTVRLIEVLDHADTTLRRRTARRDAGAGARHPRCRIARSRPCKPARCRSWSRPRCRKPWCSACSSRAFQNISRSSVTARPISATCCASTRRRASPAPSIAATKSRWRMPRPRLRWQYGETPAVVTSIGPGALQAFAGSLASASNGVGVYHIYGDETTFGEGYNMQQVPKEEQGLFGRMTALMGGSYVLHTPEALRDALRRGSLAVQSSLSRRAVLSAAAAQHPAAARDASISRRCRTGPICRSSRRSTTAPMRSCEADRVIATASRSRPVAARAGMMRRCASLPKPRAPRWCCRPARPACCRTRIRRTCMSAARRARSAAISRWRMPSWSSSSARARSVRPIAPASATSRRSTSSTSTAISPTRCITTTRPRLRATSRR